MPLTPEQAEKLRRQQQEAAAKLAADIASRKSQEIKTKTPASYKKG